MNHHFHLRSCGHSFTGRWRSLALVVILGASVSGFRCTFTESAGTNPPQVTIQNVRASRNQTTGLPVVTMDYTVKYPSDLYTSTLTDPPALTCTMEQGQFTGTRIFTGTPVSVPGGTTAPRTGQVSIRVPEDGKSIGGVFSVHCTLASDRPLAKSNTVVVDISKPPEPVVAKVIDPAGNWELTWTWSVTKVYFVGQVTGGPSQWQFQGTLDSGGNAVWTPAKGSATVVCTLTGNPLEPPGKGKMSCTATFSDGTWTGTSEEGTTNTTTTRDGKLQFSYEGAGWGSSQTEPRAHIDHLGLAPKTVN